MTILPPRIGKPSNTVSGKPTILKSLNMIAGLTVPTPKELKVSKIKAKEAEKKGRLNPQDLANVMKHLKENGFIDNHTRKVYGIDKYVIEQ